MPLSSITITHPTDNYEQFSKCFFTFNIVGGSAYGLRFFIDSVQYNISSCTGGSLSGTGKTVFYGNCGCDLTAGETYELYFAAYSGYNCTGDYVTSNVVTFTCPQEQAFGYSHTGGEGSEDDFIITWSGGFETGSCGLADFKIYYSAFLTAYGENEWSDYYEFDGYWWESGATTEGPRSFNLGTNLNNFVGMRIRIDHKFDDEHVTTGAIYEAWSVPFPEKPVNPTPADTVEDIRLSYPGISWESGSGEGAPTETYDVYVGPSSDDLSLYISGLSDISLAMPTTWLTDDLLYYDSTYYWRVDATNVYGTTIGDGWSFSSIVFTPPQISYILLPGGSWPGVEGIDYEWTGVNNMKTIKRLVGFSNNKCWYGSS